MNNPTQSHTENERKPKLNINRTINVGHARSIRRTTQCIIDRKGQPELCAHINFRPSATCTLRNSMDAWSSECDCLIHFDSNARSCAVSLALRVFVLFHIVSPALRICRVPVLHPAIYFHPARIVSTTGVSMVTAFEHTQHAYTQHAYTCTLLNQTFGRLQSD